MKTIKTIHTALILMVLAFLSACSTDNADSILGGSGGDNQGDKVTVHMTLSTAPSSGTRATELTWEDGIPAENMKSWVVAFVKDGKVVSFAEKTDVSANNRIKDEVIIKDLPKGDTYQVYSFANLTAAELDISNGAEVHFDTKQWKMNGNGFDVTKNGIPMSNKQEVKIDASGNPNKKELWVVRMLAKVTLQFKNPSKTDLVINDITISDITKNSSENGDKENIKLLPNHTDADHEQVVCSPNLVDQAATDSYTYTLSSPKTIKAGDKTENEISFYVNESKAGNTSKYFIINLNTSAGVKRYALFQDWTTIARNDHHILPISLDDYKLKFDVQSFTAIGLYPSITDNGTTLSYTCYYPEEEFHIQPKLVKASEDPKVTSIDYTNVKWELIQEDGMSDATAAKKNALLVFKTLPSWKPTTGYFEGIFNDDKADKQSALYQVTVPVPDVAGKSLIYKILFTKDLRSFAARKYTRHIYRYK
ncbi:FimB/Mfa2 family fimbrial subunit [Segatella copri]|uniref:FimB/Mfa2 family fimbrial subunit n=1 Tax=Segatella copri TaxID=165179 RepID=UPI0012917254|nr:FimB/Mfa2 family fimbrial subunit [Segatella copri]MQN36433.1 FimB/Mfa2 family fimbrial subunit [Segatella copri]MQO30996.1 FimB/Mfa2 family fimbrial subunit [Segatella copri]MQO43384.1 FimB/Mfa2 family fimbrial subunit [Segatella copri]